ncbi:MAG: dihydroorotase [Defluviitaleaceae bacterium]|nr:dihydroorotase [Defluviitaleaceae bacterium]
MRILIKNGRVIDPANNIDEQIDVLVRSSQIHSVQGAGGILPEPGDTVIDATGMWVVPGLIDMHVHLRDPGQLHKETIKTGTAAAAAGGFTTVCAMPNTTPTCDSAETVKYIKATAEKEATARVIPIGSITKNLAGEELSDFAAMKSAGIVAISDDGKTVENPALYKEAMHRAKALNLPILTHCEDTRLTGNEAEEIIIARDIILAKAAGVPLHICHVSTAHAVELVRQAQKAGQAVTAEVTPHHFTLTQEDMPPRENPDAANYKMAPPLRSPADRQAIQNALKDGTITVIATDHAPHHADEKTPFKNAMNGIIGLETAIPLAITELVNTKILTPSQMISTLTINPAKILNLSQGAGTLSEGAPADITIINPTATHNIDKNTFKSQSKNTPFHGRAVTGKVEYTILNGAIVYAPPGFNL